MGVIVFSVLIAICLAALVGRWLWLRRHAMSGIDKSIAAPAGEAHTASDSASEMEMQWEVTKGDELEASTAPSSGHQVHTVFANSYDDSAAVCELPLPVPAPMAELPKSSQLSDEGLARAPSAQSLSGEDDSGDDGLDELADTLLSGYGIGMPPSGSGEAVDADEKEARAVKAEILFYARRNAARERQPARLLGAPPILDDHGSMEIMGDYGGVDDGDGATPSGSNGIDDATSYDHTLSEALIPQRVTAEIKAEMLRVLAHSRSTQALETARERTEGDGTGTRALERARRARGEGASAKSITKSSDARAESWLLQAMAPGAEMVDVASGREGALKWLNENETKRRGGADASGTAANPSVVHDEAEVVAREKTRRVSTMRVEELLRRHHAADDELITIDALDGVIASDGTVNGVDRTLMRDSTMSPVPGPSTISPPVRRGEAIREGAKQRLSPELREEISPAISRGGDGGSMTPLDSTTESLLVARTMDVPLPPPRKPEGSQDPSPVDGGGNNRSGTSERIERVRSEKGMRNKAFSHSPSPPKMTSPPSSFEAAGADRGSKDGNQQLAAASEAVEEAALKLEGVRATYI